MGGRGKVFVPRSPCDHWPLACSEAPTPGHEDAAPVALIA